MECSLCREPISFDEPEPTVLEIETLEKIEQIIQSDKLIVIFFYADQYPLCKEISSNYAKHSVKVKEYATLVKIDGDKNPETKFFCGVDEYPTFVFYKNGEKQYEIQGTDFEELKNWIEIFK